jgi:hypothetical protein
MMNLASQDAERNSLFDKTDREYRLRGRID